MTDKRYQVFLSSTFTDLQEERRKVIQALMELDCFPAGMELFPAADEEQWRFIQQVIAECDYYVLIVGDRYGSLTPEGVSYTEKEFDFAVERGLKVLAFIRGDGSAVPPPTSESESAIHDKLMEFRKRVASGRLVKFWTSADGLAGQVALSLSKTIKTYPAVGWIRASAAASAETLTEVNELRKRVSQLEKELASAQQSLRSAPTIENLAPLSEKVTVAGEYRKYGYGDRTWSVTLSWQDLFGLIAPELLYSPNDSTARRRLTALLFARYEDTGMSADINDVVYDTIKIQLMAHRLVTIDYSKTVQGGMSLFWRLTPRGRTLMVDLRAIRTAESAGA